MVRLLVVSFVGVSLLAALPHYASRFQGALENRQQAEAVEAAQSARDAELALQAERARPTHTASYAAGRSMRLAPDARGHFNGAFRVNGRPIDGLIDTGATFVAINVSTARKLGINPAPGDFTFGVNTANGQTSAARVMLDRMEIGPIRVSDVEAFVLDDSNLSVTLIGMSFMNKLESFRVENGELLLIN